METGSIIANAYIDEQEGYWSNHRVGPKGNVIFMPASGRADYVPIEAMLVPLPPIASIVGRGVEMAGGFAAKG